jgi:TonB family protein
MTDNSLMVSAQLPWDLTPEDARRTRRINAVALLLGFLAFIIIPQLKLPKPPRGAEVIPERIARVIQEQKIELPPPPPIKKEEKKKEEVKADKPVEKVVEAEHVAKVKPVVDKAKPTESQIKDAKAKASKAIESSGIADALSDLRDFDTVATAKNPSTGGGLQKDSGAPVGTSRNMIGSKAGTGSGGLAYNGASSGYGGGVAGGKGGKGDFNLGARGTKDMKGGLIAGGGGNGATGGRGDGEGKTRGEGGVGKRTTEDIRRIFDQNGGRLNNAYQRALKDDPSMEGTVRLKLTVDPSGKVLSCEIASSALNNPELEAKILSIVKGFNFGEDNVEVWKGTYPVNFYPN